MHQGGVHVVGLESRHRQDTAPIHDDRIALGVPVAGGVADDLRVEFLEGIVPGHRPGNHVSAGAFAVQGDHVGADRVLPSVGHQPLAHDELRAGGKLSAGGAHRIVDAFDLHHLHFHRAAFFLVDLGARIQDAFALAGA